MDRLAVDPFPEGGAFVVGESIEERFAEGGARREGRGGDGFLDWRVVGASLGAVVAAMVVGAAVLGWGCVGGWGVGAFGLEAKYCRVVGRVGSGFWGSHVDGRAESLCCLYLTIC